MIQEIRQKYPNHKLRVGFTGYRETLAKERIKFILKNVDYIHFVQGNLDHSLNYGKQDMNKLISETSFDKTKFELLGI